MRNIRVNTIIRKNILIIVCFCLFSSKMSAQQVITGRITDAADSAPIPGVSIFIANSTIGIASDLSGNYSLTVPGSGSFEIVVSHVGYQSVFHKIDTPQDTHQYDVALATHEIEEITVKAAKTYNNSDVQLFWRKILGEKPSRRGMEVLNPEKVYFYKNNQILRASSREPIEIVNHQTGYRIRYVLQNFQHDYRNHETTFYAMPYFEELVPDNSQQKAKWEMKRREVYAVSIDRFLLALYRKQIHEEGFLLADQNVNREDGKIFPLSLGNL